MIVHVNVRELVKPDGFSLVTCHCTLHYKQKTEIKTKIIHCFKNERFKESIASQLSRFFQVSFKLSSSHSQCLIIHFFL